ncbi:MAG: 16S rRNA (adenine(1518)-N(6)/adenine(1519)-N(6))-dimethyltransferase RsmA [Lachnospiraceae bacterium]|nr:16S rRNA (adenine(1518)-N(6)/adenine(1519)-N(6))-dimethyltransferase RsmA [Lachnospiraceae bacterium]
MQSIATPTKTAEIVAKHHFMFRKKFGQNFLVDMSMLEKIVDSAEVTKEDVVLEIGPGIGTMTQALAERAKEVIAVEIDSALIPILKETLQEYDNVTVINEDILKLDLAALSAAHDGVPFKVVANLPYYITTPIIMALLEGDVPVESITIMVQKEVAERMQVGPGTKDYGALSLAVQYYARPELVCTVPPECFMPRPKVASAVICLHLYQTPPVSVRDASYMFRLIRASFNQRRKTLANGLSGEVSLGLSRGQVTEALQRMNLPEMVRGETLTLEQFAQLADLVMQKA